MEAGTTKKKKRRHSLYRDEARGATPDLDRLKLIQGFACFVLPIMAPRGVMPGKSGVQAWCRATAM